MPHPLPRFMACLCLFGALAAFAPTTGLADPPQTPSFQAAEFRDHPLAGRLWRVADGRFVAPTDLARALIRADFVLLGETHDNPDHHRIQRWAVDVLFGAGRQRGLVMEMIRADQQATVDRHRAAHPDDIEGLGTALRWAESGWPAWHHYAPLAAPFMKARLPLIGANLSRDTLRAVIQGGFDAFPAARRRALALDRDVPDTMLDAMSTEIVESHCGKIPAGRAASFARAQVARDAALAEGLRRAAEATPGGGAVLVAGSGHVRTDRGVRWHLVRQRTGRSKAVLSLAPLEVRADLTVPGDYAAMYGSDGLPFDYVWFTPRQPRGDPCAVFSK